MKILGVIFAIFVILLAVIYSEENQRQWLDFTSAQIGHGRFAIVESEPNSFRLFTGAIDGTKVEILKSPGQILDVSIISKSQTLVVERLFKPSNLFRILKLDTSQSLVTCEALAVSQNYLGNPIYLNDAEGDIIFFSTGKFNPDASGPSVVKHYLAVLDKGEFEVLLGDTFFNINNLTSESSHTFLGISNGTTNSIRTSGIQVAQLFELKAQDGSVYAEFIPVPGNVTDDFSTVTSSPSADLGFIRAWGDRSTGRKGRIVKFALTDKMNFTEIEVPSDRDFGNAFAEVISGGQIIIRIPSIEKVRDGDYDKIHISELVDGEWSDLPAIPLKADSSTTTDACRGNPPVFLQDFQ